MVTLLVCIDEAFFILIYPTCSPVLSEAIQTHVATAFEDKVSRERRRFVLTTSSGVSVPQQFAFNIAIFPF